MQKAKAANDPEGLRRVVATYNSAVRVHAVADHVEARVVRDLPPLPPDLDAAVEAHWHTAQARTGGRLFNGRVFSVDELTPILLSGHLTEFRRIVAQMADPNLHHALQLRPLAVCGVLRCPDGVVLGRRDAHAVYQAGMWQLPPAGSVDARALQADGSIDLRRQMLVELQEELGLSATDVTSMQAICIVEHDGSHVLDLGFALETELGAKTILAAHAQARDAAEYDPMTVVPLNMLAQRASELATTLVPTARVFLRQLQMLQV